MLLYLIRHGQSVTNAPLHWNDPVADPALSKLGIAQVKALASHLAEGDSMEQWFNMTEKTVVVEPSKGYRITRLYCSPMRRALETASIVGESIGVRPEVWIDIHERGGMFLKGNEGSQSVGHPGMSRSEISRQFPAFILPSELREEGWWDPQAGEEDLPACQARAIRVAAVVREQAREGSEEIVALISHGTFMNGLLKALANQLPGQELRYGFFNTSITRLELGRGDSLWIRYLNRLPHFPVETVS